MSEEHWPSLGKVWAQLGSPLRPGPQDQKNYQHFLDEVVRRFSPTRAVVLGVTPELYHLNWPPDAEVIALDCSRAMIDEIWPGAAAEAIEGNWLEMPLRDQRHVSLCDGGFIALKYPEAHRILRDRLAQLIAPGGRILFRLFAAPVVAGSVAGIIDDLRAKKFPSLNVLKLRLGMALQKNPETGVPVREILSTVEAVEPDLDCLADEIGWSRQRLRVIEVYRDSEARYYFPTEEQTKKLLTETDAFEFVGRAVSDYPLAERCPVVAFQRR